VFASWVCGCASWMYGSSCRELVQHGCTGRYSLLSLQHCSHIVGVRLCVVDALLFSAKVGTSWLYRLLFIVEVQHCSRIVGMRLCIVDALVFLREMGTSWLYRLLLIFEVQHCFRIVGVRLCIVDVPVFSAGNWYSLVVPVVAHRWG
jgi:hypothetical protein